MEVTPARFGSQPPVDAYAPGGFRVEETLRPGPLLLGPEGIAEWGGFEDIAPLAALAGKVDILFVGTGRETRPLPDAFRRAVDAAGMAAEPMTTPSACRTYNVLLSEGRRVAIAALPLEGVPGAD